MDALEGLQYVMEIIHQNGIKEKIIRNVAIIEESSLRFKIEGIKMAKTFNLASHLWGWGAAMKDKLQISSWPPLCPSPNTSNIKWLL